MLRAIKRVDLPGYLSLKLISFSSNRLQRSCRLTSSHPHALIMIFSGFLLSCLASSILLPYIGALQLSPENAVVVGVATQIQSLFSQTLDNKDFGTLGELFTDDAVLDGGGPGSSIVGLPAIEDFYTQTFQNASLKTQHTSDTVYVFNFTTTTASSTSYANALYFGPAVLERGGMLFPNQSVIYRESFETQYRKDASGDWKIYRQTGPVILVCDASPRAEQTLTKLFGKAIEGEISILPPLFQ